MSELTYDIRDGVAVLTMVRGSANTLSPQLRSEMAAALERAAQDDAVQAVVLTGAGGRFSGGVELTEFDEGLRAPWIDVLTRAIETHAKPVVAAMEGNALGAGFELALAAHARVAQKTCRVALPEVILGLMPSGGATQRLPRALGAQVALELMMTGHVFEAQEPKLAPLFQQLTDTAPLEAACALARDLAKRSDRPGLFAMVRGFSDPVGYQKAISQLRATVTDRDSAAADIVSCVEAAQVLPYAQGLLFEAAAFEDRMARPGVHAARYVYTAERRVGLTGAYRNARPKPVEQVVICGYAAFVSELAVFVLDRGIRLSVLTDARTGAGFAARVRAIFEGAKARGLMSEEACRDRMARLVVTSDQSVLEAADLVLDASSDGGAALDATRMRLKPGVVWGRVMRVDGGIAKAMVPEGLYPITVRPYRPCHSMPFVEIGLRHTLDRDSVATLAKLLSGRGHNLLLVDERRGLLGHEIMGLMQRAALAMIGAGMSPEAVEAGARALGFRRGPLELIEREGIAAVAARMGALFGQAPEIDLLQARAQEVARGATPGQGFYAPDGHELRPDPGLPEWLGVWRESSEPTGWPSGVNAEQGLHAAILARGVTLWRKKVVAHLSDVDLCLIKGYGFDAARGGPLHLADQGGLLPHLRVMKALSSLSTDIWAPPEDLEEMVKYGRRLMAGAGGSV